MAEDQGLAPPILRIVDQRRQSRLGVGERGLPHRTNMTILSRSRNLPPAAGGSAMAAPRVASKLQTQSGQAPSGLDPMVAPPDP